MRYLVVSDSHGYNKYLEEIIKKVAPFEAMFHLGDLQCPLEEIERMAGVPTYAVSGNNDFRVDLERTQVVMVEGHRIAMCHGHRHGVYSGLERLTYFGMENEAEVVMFGHTHMPHFSYEQGIALLNPGSASLPRQTGHKKTYAIMETDREGELHFTLCEL